MAKGGTFRSGHPLQPTALKGQVSRSGPSTQRSSAKRPPNKQQKYYLFIVADEILPSGKVIRKVLSVAITDAEQILAHPELFGIRPGGPGSGVSIAEHVLGIAEKNKKSPYISASPQRGGAPNIEGRPVYIDIEKAKAAGVKFHGPEEILADLDRYARLNPSLKHDIELFKKEIIPVEREVLLEGEIPRAAIKSATSLRLTQGLRVVQFLGVAATVYDLGVAAEHSFEKRSYKPIAAESIRQAGGWSGALAGSEIGASLGAAVGIETGPGALITGAIGAIVFGTAGYFGADWVVKRTHVE